jgi:hypothetical protein
LKYQSVPLSTAMEDVAPSLTRYVLETAAIPTALCVALWFLFERSPFLWVLAVFTIYGSLIGSVFDKASDGISAAVRGRGQTTLTPSFGTGLLFPLIGLIIGALLQNEVLALMTSSLNMGVVVFTEVTAITPLLVLVQLLATNGSFRPKDLGVPAMPVQPSAAASLLWSGSLTANS